MLALKYLLMILGAGLFGSAGALVVYDIFLSAQLGRLLRRNTTDESGAEVGALARRPFRPVRWRLALQLAVAGALALSNTKSIVAIPGVDRLGAEAASREAIEKHKESAQVKTCATGLR